MYYPIPNIGHYLHYNIQVKKSTKDIQFRKGDIYISTNQKGVRYLLETLEKFDKLWLNNSVLSTQILNTMVHDISNSTNSISTKTLLL